MEGAAYPGALYGQGFGGGDGQQLAYGVEDPRAQAQGGHYMSSWQSPGGPQGGGGHRWFS